MKFKFLIFLIFVNSVVFPGYEEYARKCARLPEEILNGNIVQVKTLVDENSFLLNLAPDNTNNWSVVPAQLAVKYFQYDILKYLLEKGCITNVYTQAFADHASRDLLQLALYCIHETCKYHLNELKYPCDPIKLVELLLKYCPADQKDKKGKTTLELARYYKRIHPTSKLLEDLWEKVVDLIEEADFVKISDEKRSNEIKNNNTGYYTLFKQFIWGKPA